MSYGSATLLLKSKLLYLWRNEGALAGLIGYLDTPDVASIPTAMASTTAINFTATDTHRATTGREQETQRGLWRTLAWPVSPIWPSW